MNSMNMTSIPLQQVSTSSIIPIALMWLKQCHKAPMSGNGFYHLFIYSDDWGIVYGIV